jgi:hypothetical protein
MSTMNRTRHICLLPTYNEWMNAKVYAAARSLSDEELQRALLAAGNKAGFQGQVGGCRSFRPEARAIYTHID